MALHNSVEGFWGEFKALPKGSAARGNFITAHMNHAPFIDSLSKHPQGKQVHAQLTTFMNSKQNAGPAGAKVTMKGELEKGWPKDSKENEDNFLGFLDHPVAQDHYMENTGAVPQQHTQANPAAPGLSGEKYSWNRPSAGAEDQVRAQNWQRQVADAGSSRRAVMPGMEPHFGIGQAPNQELGAPSPADRQNEEKFWQHTDALSQGKTLGAIRARANKKKQTATVRSQNDLIAGANKHLDRAIQTKKAEAILKTEGETSVADKETYTVEEAADILRKDFHEKLVKYSREIENLMKRETNKSLIPTHNHNTGAAASSGTEDIAAGQANPKGTKKAEKCMKCGSMHEEMEKCGEIKMGKEEYKLCGDTMPGKEGHKCGRPVDHQGHHAAYDSKVKNTRTWHNPKSNADTMLADAKEYTKKSDLVDSKGKLSDNHTDPQSADMPDTSPVEPDKREDASGGKITKSGGPSAMAKRAMSMSKSGDFKSKLKTAIDQNVKDYNGPAKPKAKESKPADSRLAPGPFYQGKPWQVSGEKKAEVTKATPPMAKPPSGANMGSTVPTSKPAAPPKMPGAPKSPMGKQELEKAGLGMAAHGQREAAAMGHPAAGAAPAPAAKPVKLPGQAAQADRAASFADQMPSAAPAKPALPKPAAAGPAGKQLGLASPKAAGVTRSAGPVQNAARPAAPAKPGIFGKLFGGK